MIERFELSYYRKAHKQMKIDTYADHSFKKTLTPLNIIFSQIHSVNAQIHPLVNLNIVRLYLIKSYKGRAHAVGKPVRGQRTWSNAWNSFKVNKSLRVFVSEASRKVTKNLRTEKINYKVIKRKYSKKN